MKGRAVAALAVTVVLTASCSGSGSSPRSTSSIASAEVTTTSSTTTAPEPGACGANPASPPAVTVRETSGQADVDGDGSPDSVEVYGTGTETAPGPWYVAVDTGRRRGRRQVVIADADPDDANQQIRYLGVAEAGGPPVVFVAVGSGASATIVGLFQLVGCDLVRVQAAASSTFTFTVGGTVTHLNGARCRGGADLELLQAISADGTSYTGSRSAAVIANGTLTAQPPTTEPSIPPDDLAAYGTLDCPGVEPI